MDFQTYSRDRRSYIEAESLGINSVVWRDTASRAIRKKFPTPGLVASGLAFADDDQSIRALLWSTPTFPLGTSVSQQESVSWDLITGAETRRPITPKLDSILAFSRDGRLCAHLDMIRGGIGIWDLDLDQARGNLIPVDGDFQFAVGMLHMTPAKLAADGRTLIVSQANGRIEFWDMIESRLVRAIPVHQGASWLATVELTPDGRTLVSSGSKWERLAGFWLWVSRLSPAWTPDAETEVVVVDLQSQAILARSAGSYHPRLSPDGRTIVTHEADGSFAVRAVPELTTR